MRAMSDINTIVIVARGLSLWIFLLLAEASFSPLKGSNCTKQVYAPKVGPINIEKEEFAIGALPQEESA